MEGRGGAQSSHSLVRRMFVCAAAARSTDRTSAGRTAWKGAVERRCGEAVGPFGALCRVKRASERAIDLEQKAAGSAEVTKIDRSRAVIALSSPAGRGLTPGRARSVDEDSARAIDRANCSSGRVHSPGLVSVTTGWARLCAASWTPRRCPPSTGALNMLFVLVDRPESALQYLGRRSLRQPGPA